MQQLKDHVFNLPRGGGDGAGVHLESMILLDTEDEAKLINTLAVCQKALAPLNRGFGVVASLLSTAFLGSQLE